MNSQGMIRCPHCGKMHPQETIYCPENGMPIWQSDSEPSQAPPPPRRRNTVWIILGVAIGVAILCLGAVATYLLWIRPAARTTPSPTKESIVLATVFQPTATIEPSATNPAPSVTPSATASVTPSGGLWDACPGADYQSRLRIGDKAKVSSDPPLANRVRSDASLTSAILGYIQPDEEVTILDGPGCSANWVWWKVRSLETSLEGWTAEGDDEGYWLVPDND
jgi:hypothetical protein